MTDDITVLCVDSDADERETLVVEFDDRAHMRALGAEDVASATGAIERTDVDCLVSAYDLPDGTAFDAFERGREADPNLACVLFTDRGHGEVDSDAFRETVTEFLPKGGPDSRDRLVDMVRNAVTNRTQVGFPLPPDEDERLERLSEYDVAELATVDAFDRIAELVANHFDIAVAFVGLVDEAEERFVACHGADWKTLTREDSICTYSILEDEVMVVENVQADPRFEHNETLKQLDIRSYAGADITLSDGTVLGELCLIHDEPRTYTDGELADLQLFADEVSEQLELRRRLGDRSKQADTEAEQ